MAYNILGNKLRPKRYKLIVHPRTFGTADLILNPKDFPHLKLQDIVEIYHQEEEYSRLLLQVTTFKDDLQGRDAVSVEQSVAATFQLRTYSDVCVNKIDPATVSLDSVEVIFKDQYIGRSEMWRLKKALVNTCVYLNKKIEFCGGTARVQVYEMWTQGERVACGVIMEDTKVVFRSSTSMVYLFIQMSSEMWDFDIHGDLYFEKAVNGFLTELFQKWKKHGSNHEVTVVLFSRAFYKATNLEEFPEYMQECLQKDYKGSFYEDFYRVVVQNERYDDWSGTLLLLKRLFTDYKRMILDYHKKPNCRVPPVYLSTAARGNFLEVLNISLNVFEKHYLERSLDRTGQLIVVVSPGVGVFEVDRELANVIKQRIIDNGVGSDLVCVGEQPLHAVPLFKFHNKDSSINRDDYSMPHWINLSFYSSGKKLAYSKFMPRIRLPPRRTKPSSQNVIKVVPKPKLPTDVLVDENSLSNPVSPADVDYDAYDADVFTLPPTHSASVQKAFGRVKKTSFSQGNKTLKWKMSDPDIYRSQLFTASSSAPPITRSTSIAISPPHSQSYGSNSFLAHLDLEKPRSGEFCMDDDLSPSSSNTVTSSISLSTASTLYTLQTNSIQSNNTATSSTNLSTPSVCPGRALINPFDPSHLTIKLTSNRRRWTHVFPKGPTGVVIQQHHYHLSPTDNEADKKSEICDSELGSRFSDDSPLARSPSSVDSKSRSCIRSYTLFGSPESNLHKKTQALLWGVTGEQEWTPALTTGVDWKSLTIPACLPITTDYFPDEVCLKTDYVFSDHNLLPDDLNADYAQKRAIYRKPLSTNEVFLELISQRLAQGFQIVVNSDSGTSSSGGSSVILAKSSPNVHPVMEFKLSIGRVFHKVALYGSEIRVTRYTPRHPYPPFVIDYRYRFQAPDHPTYGISWVSFNAENLENYKWNYLDHYICTRGDTDFALTESLKYWRFRMYAVPAIQPATKRLFEGYPYCDIYTSLPLEEHTPLKEGFLKFIESPINRIRRMNIQSSVGSRDLSLSSSQINRRRHSTGIVFLTPPQEKNVLSNHRLVTKNNSSGSGSKVLEKSRIFPTNDTMVPLAFNLDADHLDASTVFEMLRSKDNISNADIIEIMSHPQLGIEFLSKYPSLPSNTFVSYDAVRWLADKVIKDKSEKQAIDKLEAMRNDGFICHASGDKNHPFILGYYLYFIVQNTKKTTSPLNKEKVDRIEPICDLDTFENEWVEIELKNAPAPKRTNTPKFLLNNLDAEEDHNCSISDGWTVPFYKQANLEVDVNNKSDRIEWSHIKYQSEYRVDRAFEFSIQWVAASGPMVADLIFNLVRKAQVFRLQLIPVPSDPHALPYSLKSDPLRGPVFVPLDIEGIMGNKSYLFEEYPEESWARRLILFQEAIAMKFGFMACATDRVFPHHNQYVHVTGNVFLLIVSPLCEYASEPEIQTSHAKSSSLRVRSTRIRTIKDENEITVSPHQEYISRHVTAAHNTDSKRDNRVGFLWSWNHMVGRRWKSSNVATGDESFQDKLLHDFRQFCSNAHNRLKVYWNSCLELKVP